LPSRESLGVGDYEADPNSLGFSCGGDEVPNPLRFRVCGDQSQSQWGDWDTGPWISFHDVASLFGLFSGHRMAHHVQTSDHSEGSDVPRWSGELDEIH
jgi:hypothetical protein